MSRNEFQVRFDRFLGTYQKVSLILILPALMSAFSCFVKLFATNYNLTFAQGLILGLFPLFPSNGALWCLLISLGLLGLFIALGLFAAKGKLWCFLIAAGLHLADTVYLITLFSSLSATTFSVSLIIHVLVLGASVFGVISYVRADKLLKAHPHEILKGDKKN